ncbi:cell surface ecto-5'-nucleotidase Nt5e [Streptococcus caprae]|uniref:Cell surface ecto-5'-nucleotidase Nt5e n=1 Tax=Streptococcus caprae TaxID=1640501 RepID=A0ABV8CTY2_9STRE
MKKKALLIPTLSTLFVSNLVLANAVSADEATTSAASNVTSSAVDTGANVSSAETSVPSASVSETAALVSEATTAESDVAPATSPASSETTTASATESSEAAAAPIETSASATSIATDTVTILHTNDMHGRIEESKGVIGVAKLATVVEETRAQGTTLVLDAGDAFQGMPISNSSKGEELAAIMNEIGYDAMAVGNHEFDFGLDQAIKYKELLNFPILSSNVYLNGARIFQASTVIDKDKTVEGDEFVVIGVTTPETATKTHPKNVAGVTFTDPVTEVNNVIAQLEANAKAEGKTYNKYIVLSHLGVDATTPTEWQGSTLAKALSENAALAGKTVIFIDGHSHTLLNANYGSNVTYNQTGSYLNNIGKIVLNSSGVVSSGVIPASDASKVTANVNIAAKVAEIKARYDAKNAAVLVANNPVSLNGDRENVRVRETNQGNAVSDALLQYGQTGFTHKSNLAVMNGGGIRATLPAGEDITVGDVISVLPFGNIISQIEVTGQNIYDMYVKSLGSQLQKDASGNPVLDENGLALLDASGGFLQTAGARVFYDTSLPVEDRVLYIEIYDPETESYLPLELTKTYYLATNDFLAAGGDGYTMLGGAREEGPSLDEVYAEYLKTADLTQYGVIAPNSRLISIDVMVDTDGDGFVDLLEYIAGTNLEDANDYPGKKDPTTPTQPTIPDEEKKVSASENKVGANKVPVSYVTVAKSANHSPALPATGSEDSILATLAGFGLMTYAFYGMSKKRKTN